MPIAAPRKTITTDSGRYWKLVCSIRCINNMPSARTHSTKNMDMELLCSSSAEPLSGRTGSAGATVVVVALVELTASGLCDDTEMSVVFLSLVGLGDVALFLSVVWSLATLSGCAVLADGDGGCFVVVELAL